MPCVHLPDLPETEQRSPRGTFRSFVRDVSLALGGQRNGGTWCGGHPFDVQLRRIPPGAAVCPFHAHLAQWEYFVVETGTATVRAGAETHVLGAGEVWFHPPGEPHQLLNRGETDLVVLIVADNPPLDAFHYPDSGKWGLRPPGIYFRLVETGYFDGEEDPLSDAPPYRPSGTPPAPPLAPFAQRHLRPDTLPWDEWASPKGKFRGAFKEVSIALGAARNTPAGLGGHPFDLELGRLEPGQSGCPFHSHAAQWELFLIRSGRGTFRIDAATVDVRAGDAILHPPGTAHQLRAAPDSGLSYLLIADNPPVDYWHYPDSGKRGLRSPRLFFRPQELDYFDGEE